MKAALHSVAAMCAALCAALLAGCERERATSSRRKARPSRPARATRRQPARRADARPGCAGCRHAGHALHRGRQRLCRLPGQAAVPLVQLQRCHAPGGGGDWGPALSDDKWIYGSAPNNIFLSIVQGRPNGMPSFGGHIPEDQVWQLVAYVRSLSGQLRKDVAPGRSDALQASEPEVSREREHPQPYLPRDGAQNPTR
jgi:cytochrome c oxidase cbb3-type subunit 3